MHNIAKNKHHVGEEVANAVTHGLGALAAVVALVLMLIKATPVLSGVNFAAVAIYGGSLVLLFLCSTLYHSFTHLPSGAWLQRLDHSAIFFADCGYLYPISNDCFTYTASATVIDGVVGHCVCRGDD
jgi:hemolysin III